MDMTALFSECCFYVKTDVFIYMARGFLQNALIVIPDEAADVSDPVAEYKNFAFICLHLSD